MSTTEDPRSSFEKAILGKVYNKDDYVFYVDCKDKKAIKGKESEETNLALREFEDTSPNSHQICVHRGAKPGEDPAWGTVVGRAQSVSCFAGNRWSISLRSKSAQRHGEFHYYGRGTPREKSPDDEHQGYAPSRKRGSFLLSIHELCEILSKCIFNARKLPAQGLVVVAGATASAKSNTARGLIYSYLTNPRYLPSTRRDGDRRPHLITYEDPIEEYFEPPDYDSTQVGIDYTPRDAGKDFVHITKSHSSRVKNPSELNDIMLESALYEAKRQTPDVFFIGELRGRNAWQNALEFAGSGHLLITTTHASSLVETYDQILAAVEADTPARRGQVAQKVLAVVHQTLQKSGDKKVLLPSLWRQTDQGISTMTTEGLSSILPHNDLGDESPADSQVSSLGRYWFMREMLGLDCPVDLANKVWRMDLNGI